MKRTRTTGTAITCALLLAAAVGCGSATTASRGPAARDAPIRILWIGDTTGPIKAYGDVQLAGVRGAVDYFNHRGGIAGHHVTVQAVSDNGDPTTAASVLTRQLASGVPTVVIAGSVSGDSGAMIPVLARRRAFAISLVDGQAQCATDASRTCPHFWALAAPTSVSQQSAVDWIASKGYKKVGLLEETTAQTAAESPAFLRAAAAAGLTVTTASYPATALDATPQMQALQQRGAEVVYSEGLGSGKFVFAARARLGWDVPVIFDPPASGQDLTKVTTAANLANAYENALFVQDARIPQPAARTMVRWARRHADVTALPLIVTSSGWDAVVAFNAAVEQAGGSLDVEALDDAMLHLPPTDPLRTETHRLGWTTDNHENVLAPASDFVIIPVGPLVNGQVRAP